MQYRPAALVATTMVACFIALTACSSSNNDSPALDDDPVPAAAEPSLTFHSVKTFRFSWTDVSDAAHYKLLENPDGLSGFAQVGDDVSQGTERFDHVVPLYARTNAQYILQTCTHAGCVDSEVVNVHGTLEDSIGRIKANLSEPGDWFGYSVNLSADGNTLVIGAPNEKSIATGINGDQSDNSADGPGAAYVFVLQNGKWIEQAYLKASNTDDFRHPEDDFAGGEQFGYSVSLSVDGNTLAVGAPFEHGGATGINGDQSDNSAARSGAVYIFSRRGDEWHQQAYVKASNTEADLGMGRDEWGDYFGISVSLSADGNTLAVGASGEDSGATGINGDETSNTRGHAGAVYVFTQTEGRWRQQAYLKASNTGGDSFFGRAISLSADGSTLAVGAPGEDSNATGVNGDQFTQLADRSGAVYVFTHSGDTWNQQAYVKASNTESGDFFGHSVTISTDGNTLAVGAWGEDSNATGVNGDQNKDIGMYTYVGAVYIYTRADNNWDQQAYIKASNAEERDYFGESVSLSADGKTLAVGAWREGSNATGVNGNQSDNSAHGSGAAYVFTQSSGDWSQQAYLKASNTYKYGNFGISVSMGVDGKTLAVGSNEAVFLY